MMMDKKKFEDMLAALADQYPELEKEAMSLHSDLMDVKEPDVAEEADEGDMDNADEENAEHDGEGELSIAIMPAPGKKHMPIPPDLMDEEDKKKSKK